MRRVCVGLMAVLLLAGAVAAQEVTIDVRDAPLAEVVKLLKQQTGAPIIEADEVPRETPPVTLRFERAPLRRVIRELCAQAGLSYRRHLRAYQLLKRRGKPDNRPRCLVEGYEVLLSKFHVTRSRSLDFRDETQPLSLVDAFTIELAVRPPGDEATAKFDAFDPAVRAVTDTGAVLEPKPRYREHQAHPLLQDEIHGELWLAPPPQDAITLATLQGDLILYADLDQAEFDFGLDEVGTTKKTDQIAVTFQRYSTETRTAFFAVTVPTNPPAAPYDQRWAAASFHISVITPNGLWFSQLTTSPSCHEGPVGERYTFEAQRDLLPAQVQPGVKINLIVTVPHNPTGRLHYKFENVPLPTWQENE